MSAFILQFCSSSKNAASTAPKYTYTGNVKSLMLTHCTPCHFPPKGNKKPYDSYSAVKNDIDSILSRVNKNPGEKGFMPFKHPKLPDSTINVLVQWKKDGFPEN
jgi:hypothetical protein